MDDRTRRVRVRLEALRRGTVPTGVRYPVKLRAEVAELARDTPRSAQPGPDVSDSFRRAAVYVAKILKAGSPQRPAGRAPMKFELAINLKTATALGLTIPQSLLLRADEVIEWAQEHHGSV
jgi:hypothetical protein